MADKAFTIDEQPHSRRVTLNIPPFMKDSKLAAHDVKLIHEITTRAIDRIKNVKIFDGTIPNNIPAATVSKMFYVCNVHKSTRPPHQSQSYTDWHYQYSSSPFD